MSKSIAFLFVLSLLISCSGENAPLENKDSLKDSSTAIEVPQFDISGQFEALFLHGETRTSSENGMHVISTIDLQQDDSLYFQYKTANPCEECRVEIQIWRNDKYVEVVRDTGFGGPGIYIPASLFLNSSKFGTPEYERLSVYLSVRQYHPVETGNKRFLFYLELE